MPTLSEPVNDSDHTRGGDEGSPVTLIEYGDYQCSVCGRAHPVIKSVQKALGDDLRFVFRNFPLTTIHQYAEKAAETAEIAGAAGKYWEMHDILFENQRDLDLDSLTSYATSLGLNQDEFVQNLVDGSQEERVRRDFLSGAKSGVNGTPTFFVNGERYDGAWEHGALLHYLQEVILHR